MRAIERFIGVATTAWLLSFWFLPPRISVMILLGLFVSVGLWSLLYPQGILGWVKARHPEIDPTDESLWWVPRLIGACFIGISFFALVVIVLHN